MEKKENFISILITNYNKEKFIRNSIKSILNQNYKNYEIILFDDCSSDNSLKLINDFKKIKIIKNKKKKFKSPSLNQIHGVVRAFKKSRGNLICLLDSDDVFEKNKLKEINSYFHQNHKVELLANLPNDKSYFKLKRKVVNNNIWPSIFPTSCISFRRKFFKNYNDFLKINKFSNLEIDARLIMYSYYKNNFDIIEKKLTKYITDKKGISAIYKKFSINWWFKRKEAFDYLVFILEKRNLVFSKSLDYYITNLVYFFLNLFKK